MKDNLSKTKEAKPINLIPNRSKQAIKDLLDLTDYYTASLDDDSLLKPGANLRLLPKGVQEFGKVVFDVRGLIQLAGRQLVKDRDIVLPKAARGIKVNFKGSKIHFFHGTIGYVKEDTKIGEYIINYVDGRSMNIPLVYGRNVKDWWIKKGDPIPIDAVIAWVGENEAAKKQGFDIQLYRYTVNNPLPDIEIKTIDFVSELTDSSPFLIAITVEAIRLMDEEDEDDQIYEWFDAPNVYNDIIPRSNNATTDQIDLSDYYNASLDDDWLHHAGHDLHDLPKGLQVFGGVTFDVRGLLQIAGAKSLKVTGLALPEEIKGIKVNRKGRLIHFLHACAFTAKPGTKIGVYIIHYSNGEVREAPILYKQNVRDWWVYPEEGNVTDKEVEEVWQGSNAATRRHCQKTHLIKYTWKNPLPDVEITYIDFTTTLEDPAPFLVAITICM